MSQKMRGTWVVTAIIVLSSVAMSQGPVQKLAITGRSGTIPVTQFNGRNYVEVEALARVVNGSLSFAGTQVALTLPGTDAGVPSATPAPPEPTSNSEFSKQFLRAGIEAMTTIREWHTALASAIANAYPVTQEGLAQYETLALRNLRLAETAVVTEGDGNLAQLAASAYQKMKNLSDKYVAKRTNMNYVAPDSLANDPQDQSLIACGRSLAAMAASGQFTDAPACR